MTSYSQVAILLGSKTRLPESLKAADQKRFKLAQWIAKQSGRVLAACIHLLCDTTACVRAKMPITRVRCDHESLERGADQPFLAPRLYLATRPSAIRPSPSSLARRKLCGGATRSRLFKLGIVALTNAQAGSQRDDITTKFSSVCQ